MPVFVTEYPQFFTASIKGWYKLLEPDKYKNVIKNSLHFLIEDKRTNLYAFVILPDHIHLIWQMQPLIHPKPVQRDFLKYTAKPIKHNLQKITRRYCRILNLMQMIESCALIGQSGFGNITIHSILAEKLLLLIIYLVS